MRKGLLAGLSGLVCVAAISCGEEEENPSITLPESVFSTSTAMAIRLTGPYSLNDDLVSTMLGVMANQKLSFTDVATRGGMPSGTLRADPAGSAPQQIKALIENEGLLSLDDSVDLCGNPMLAAFVTPDMAQDILDLSNDQITGLAIWPGVCGADVNCDTTKQGMWEIGFSRDHGTGDRDLIAVLSPVAGPETQPGFQGHLLGYMLTPNNTGNHMLSTALYGNIRSLTVSAFGLVKFAKAGISLRPSLPLPGMPTRVWTFPAEARTLGGSDVIVGIQPHDLCARSWAQTFGAQQPYGCAEFKSLVLDTTSRQGSSLWSNTDQGDDVEKTQELGGDLDDWIKTFEYQVKTQIVCPDVSEPGWDRIDIPLGSVEVFQCPDGDIDRCIAFHDLEDYWCELGPPIALEDENVHVEAALPRWVGGSTEYSGNFQANTTGSPRNITYTVDGDTYTLVWTRTHNNTGENPLAVSTVVNDLNAAEIARGAPRNLIFSVDDDTGTIQAEAARDLGPGVGFTWTGGEGGVASALGLTGSASHTEPTLPPIAGDHYFVTAVNTGLNFAYVKVNGTNAEPAMVYVDNPSDVLGVFAEDGTELTISERTNSHCPTRGTVAFPIPSAAYVKLAVNTDGNDTIRVVSSNLAVNVQ